MFDVEKRFLFDIDENRALVPNPGIVADYRRVLESGRAPAEASAIPRRDREPIVLFLTQAWGANGELSIDAEVSTVLDVAHRLRNTAYRLVLKLHPHDHADKYADVLREKDVMLMEDSLVLERILPSLEQSDAVVSYNSTALLTAAVLYSIPAFTVGENLLNRPETGPWFRDFHQEFLVLARHHVRAFDRFVPE
jgi:hypothetical protein